MANWERFESFITGKTSSIISSFLKDIFNIESKTVVGYNPLGGYTKISWRGYISGLLVSELDEEMYDATWLLFPEAQMVCCCSEGTSSGGWYFDSIATYNRSKNLYSYEAHENSEGSGVFSHITSPSANEYINLSCPHCSKQVTWNKFDIIVYINPCPYCSTKAIYRRCEKCDEPVGFEYDDQIEDYLCPKCGQETEDLDQWSLGYNPERSETSEEQLPPIHLDKELLFRLLSWAKENLDQQELASATERIQALME